MENEMGNEIEATIWGSGLTYITPIVENQRENRKENEMEAELCCRDIGIMYPGALAPYNHLVHACWHAQRWQMA